MTRFEKETLHTLLNMYENEIAENGLIFNGEKVSEERTEDYKKKIQEIAILIWTTD